MTITIGLSNQEARKLARTLREICAGDKILKTILAHLESQIADHERERAALPPWRKVVSSRRTWPVGWHERLECGHVYNNRTGHRATRRRCAECTKEPQE